MVWVVSLRTAPLSRIGLTPMTMAWYLKFDWNLNLATEDSNQSSTPKLDS